MSGRRAFALKRAAARLQEPRRHSPKQPRPLTKKKKLREPSSDEVAQRTREALGVLGVGLTHRRLRLVLQRTWRWDLNKQELKATVKRVALEYGRGRDF